MITKYHPVFYNGKWSFPINLKSTKKVRIESYFNFVLDKGHSIIANGIECVTLGHGFKGDVIEHDYLGSNQIIADLKKLKGWEAGYIHLPMNSWERNPKNMKINGLNTI